jgi:hypothetical protein
MIIDRRELIVGAAVVAIAPTLNAIPLPLAAEETEPGPVIFMIEGWSPQDDHGTDNVVWLRIGHGWRTSWL